MKESALVIFFVFGLSVLSYFLNQTEKERAIASDKGTRTTKVPARYQK